MNNEIIARACCRRGGVFGFKSNDWGPRGMLGGVASSFSSRNSQAKATLPTPMALRARNRRRDQRPIALPGGSSDRFIGGHQQDGGTVERRNFKPLKTV